MSCRQNTKEVFLRKWFLKKILMKAGRNSILAERANTWKLVDGQWEQVQLRHFCWASFYNAHQCVWKWVVFSYLAWLFIKKKFVCVYFCCCMFKQNSTNIIKCAFELSWRYICEQLSLEVCHLAQMIPY